MGYIYWIASYPKSGNTWMRAFLTSIVTGDAGDLSLLQGIAPDDNDGSYFQNVVKVPLNQATPADIAAARPHAQRAMAAAAKGFLFLKSHSMLATHLGTLTITPDVTAGAIYIVRNPLDVAVSYSEFRNRALDRTIELMNQRGRVLDRPAFGAYQFASSWADNVESWTRRPHDRLLTLRYEDMLDDPQTSFGKVVTFLQMQVEPDAVAGAIERSSFSALQATEKERGFRERPKETKEFFRSGRKGEWRERLTEAQIAKVVQVNEPQMRRFGYWLDEFDALRASPRLAGTSTG